MSGGLRVGVDVGGTFTKAVAVTPQPLTLRGQAVVPTTHADGDGAAAGVAAALRELFAGLGAADRARVELVAYSTTTAMNALLEGDVAKVGVLGLGAEPELRRARRRTRIGDVALAPGRELRTEHAFLDVTGGLDDAAVQGAVAELADRRGCTAIAVSGAFAVDAPGHEERVVAACRARGIPVCAGHELTGAYGLEVRTVSAAINASILGVVERTASVVENVLHEVGIDVPLLVLRGDGGAMGLEAFRRTPSFTVGSGPAAGVAAALHRLGLTNGIVLECGGTSSNVSVVRHGRTVLRSLRVMGRPTAISSVDSWVVGAAGGSMGRLGRRGLAGTGPRSAHVAGLGYACFAEASQLQDAAIELVAPRPGDPERYVVVRAAGGRFALTATCAAVALGLVETGDREAALLGFAALAARLRRTPEQAARALLDDAVGQIAEAVAEAARTHDFARDVPVVALGGSGAALAGEVAARLGRPLLLPDDAPVLSSIGAALSLVRAEVRRHGRGTEATAALIREAQAACVAAGAAPLTVAVETAFRPDEDVMVATATGAVALQSGVSGRSPLAPEQQRAAAASAIDADADELEEAGDTGFYRLFREDGGGRVAVVDGLGAVALADRARMVLACHDAPTLVADLSAAVRAGTRDLGVAAIPPRVSVIAGAHVIDLSQHRRPEDVVAGARTALEDHADGPAIAVVWA
jgi:N-methylhydantoinase A/oxoprolinase/acetone carboxylase beta subunit